MYSVFLPTKRSGNWLGAHQKFDRLAYRLLVPHIKTASFPDIKHILDFEGFNGPDGLKAKSPGKDEPSHFYDPIEDKGPVLEWVIFHYSELVAALKEGDQVRSGFEAAWLAHAVVDGLTPAHQFPYDEHLKDIHEEAGHSVTRFKDKLVIKGETSRETFKHTMKFWGKKGMLATHMHFEAGVAATVSAYRFGDLWLQPQQITDARQLGYLKLFKQNARLVSQLHIYERFARSGWTVGIARQIRHVLAPTIIETVSLIWLLAYEEALGQVNYHTPKGRKSRKT